MQVADKIIMRPVEALIPYARNARTHSDAQVAQIAGSIREGADFKITLTPPGTSQRTDKPLLLQVLGITENEYTARFCHPVHTGFASAIRCTPAGG
jgi:hypothetical protein